MAVMHKINLSLVHKTTLYTMRIKITKAVISFQVNHKPTRAITSISKAHQVYRIFQDLQKAVL